MRMRFWGVIGLALACQAAPAQQTVLPSVFLPEAVIEPASSSKEPSALQEPSVLKDLTPLELPPAHHAAAEKTSGLLFTGELLLLTPRQSNLDFALVDGKNDLIPAGSMQSLHLRTQAGLRTGIAYRTERGWDIGFNYSFFNTSDAYGVTAPDGGLLYPSLTRPGLINEARSAYGKATFTMNNFDAVIGRSWEVDEDFWFRFLGGLRFATMQNAMQATYDGRDAMQAFAQNKSNFSGVGPMFGLEANWNIGSGFGVFSKANGGLLSGTQRVQLLETNNGGGTVYTDFHDRYGTVVPFMQLGLGMEYRYNGVFIRAGYEVTQYFDVVDRPVFLDDFAEGKLTRRVTNLALDGLFLQAGFSY
ncbi:Lpg1974 family pore-forming outer membrane protein [Zavarzinella formosa]|uniref:Lpg1974 family pore-forming outer membrane protein n=1 Tax=Zavarzinella formosa TaxID=360055 RepID=UPI0003191BE8|nr:Lpg1974 family pore-forming outer membrane protein [Zavarzinella formosa]